MTLALIGAGLPSLHAQIAYDESVSGDFANSGALPTSVALLPGPNLTFGNTGRIAATDRDYFTFTVPSGYALTSLIEQPNTTVGGLSSFLGLQAGSPFTVPPTTTTADGL